MVYNGNGVWKCNNRRWSTLTIPLKKNSQGLVADTFSDFPTCALDCSHFEYGKDFEVFGKRVQEVRVVLYT